ncbi:hypothetical protein KKH86_00035, partial [Patescibacteria group bacterium]|nr:hypothetical protein [Patescibacteria group bacterium]
KIFFVYMFKCLNVKIICIIILTVFLISSAQVVMAGKTMDGLKNTAEVGYGELYKTLNTEASEGNGIPIIIGKVVGALLAFVGVLFFILMIYGGFLWMTARGNEQEVTKAKDLIVSATIGLIIVLASYAITAYIGNALTTGI